METLCSRSRVRKSAESKLSKLSRKSELYIKLLKNVTYIVKNDKNTKNKIVQELKSNK